MIVDNCPAHPNVPNLKVTKLVFLPLNTRSKLQPCDQGIIYSLKCHYRKEVMKLLLHHIDAGGNTSDFSISLLEAMRKLCDAWSCVTPQSVVNCFCKVGFLLEYTGCNEDVSNDEHWEFTALKEKNTVHVNVGFADFVNVHNNIAVTSPVSNENTIASVVEQQKNDSEDDDDCGGPAEHVSSHTALTAVSTLRTFFMQQDSEDVESDPLLNDIEILAENFIHKKQVQTNIFDFFTE